MSYAELAAFPYTAVTAALPATQMSSTATTAGSGPGGRGCCENGRPIMTDPHTGQTICSCQYSSTLLNYSRVPGLAEGVYGTTPFATPATPGYMPLTSDGSAFYSPLANAAYDMKESPDAWRTLGGMATCFPYDPSMAVYPYGTGYGGLDLNARRKNATRETTNTLKAWLYEHRKNPYPTKGEKIMLAIITKMTLTQVSTWFANARRRLKKENKMTWSPRNRSEDGGDDDNDDDLDNKDCIDANISGAENDDDDNLNDTKEKIINVDEESNHSLKGLHMLDAADDSLESRQQDCKDNDTSSPVPSVGDDSRVEEPSPSLSRDSDAGGTTFNVGQSGNERDIQTRPKIWSVTDFLQSSTKSSVESTNSATVKSSSHSKPPVTSVGGGYFYLPSSSHSWVPGRYGSLSSYPLSISHSTLSYPYTLSSHTSTKQSLTNNVSSLSDTERNSSSKIVRPSNGLFSPARDIDSVKNGEI